MDMVLTSVIFKSETVGGFGGSRGHAPNISPTLIEADLTDEIVNTDNTKNIDFMIVAI